MGRQLESEEPVGHYPCLHSQSYAVWDLQHVLVSWSVQDYISKDPSVNRDGYTIFYELASTYRWTIHRAAKGSSGFQH